MSAREGLREVFCDVASERERQDAKWGQQNHPDGTGEDANPGALWQSAMARDLCNLMARQGRVTWRDILTDEVAEAFAETDPAKLRAELVQVAAVACSWAEAIDRRALDGAR